MRSLLSIPATAASLTANSFSSSAVGERLPVAGLLLSSQLSFDSICSRQSGEGVSRAGLQSS